MFNLMKQCHFPVSLLKLTLESLESFLLMASSTSGHDALQDYIENHSYLMRPQKVVPAAVEIKSDPLLESFERWNQDMKAKMALEKQLQDMSDLDRLLYEALQSQASDANAGSLKESRGATQEPPRTAKAEETAGMDPSMESGIASRNASMEVDESNGIAERSGMAAPVAKPISETQQVQSGACRTAAAPESMGTRYVEPQWTKEEWRQWLHSEGYASRRAYERLVRNKFRKPSAKWRYD